MGLVASTVVWTGELEPQMGAWWPWLELKWW